MAAMRNHTAVRSPYMGSHRKEGQGEHVTESQCLTTQDKPADVHRVQARSGVEMVFTDGRPR